MNLGALLLVFMAGSAPSAESPWSSLAGSGLLTIRDTRTLPPKRFTIATTLHNRDRDPLGIDIFDYGASFAVGITPRIEAYGSGVFSRVVVVPDRSGTLPVLPPPPLDLVLRAGTSVPARPYYAIYPGMPYANGEGDQRFSDFVPGELVVGAKMRLNDPAEGKTRFAASADIKLPLSRRLSALESGSGTGAVDVALRMTAERRLRGFDLVATGGFVRVGSPGLPDHIILAESDNAAVTSEALRLPHRIEFGLGVRRELTPRLAAVGEILMNLEIAGGTPQFDSAPPTDLLAGLQTRLWRARIGAGVLYSARALQTGRVRGTPFAGYADLSRSSTESVRGYLEQLGLAGANFYLRPDGQVVAPTVPGVPLPPRGRVIPETYTIFSEHQTGLVFNVGFAF